MSSDTIKPQPWGLAVRFRRSYWCIAVTLASVLCASPVSGQVDVVPQRARMDDSKATVRIEDPSRLPATMDATALLEAAMRAQELWKDIRSIDLSNGSLRYDKSIIDRMRAFYRSGSSDPVVTREFCRNVVVAIIWDLFLIRVHDTSAEEVSDARLGDTDIQNALDDKSALLFRAFLMRELLPTAPHDLGSLQQARLYRLAGMVLRPERDRAIKVLNAVAAKLDPEDQKRVLVQLAIDDLNSD